MLSFASICPHPPLIIPTIGKPGDLKLVSKTIHAMENLAKIFKEAGTETVLLISPHGPLQSDQFTINQSPILSGNFYDFGDVETELLFKNDQNLLKEIETEARNAKIPLEKINIEELDHGSSVPLYYLAKSKLDFKVVPLTFSLLDTKIHFKFGKVLQTAISNLKSRVGIVASGDLSHRLTLDAPAGYSPRGKEFDDKLIELIRRKNIKEILNLDSDLIEDAGECGFRSILILLGALDGLNWQPEILSYEGPFGVGYSVINFKIK
jgi:AmmeMemoRadiSam system protein B